MQWSYPRCGECWSGSLGGWDGVTFYTRLMALAPTEPCRHGREAGFRRLVALSGPPGSHVHTDGMGKPHGNRPHHLESSAWHCPTPQRRAQWHPRAIVYRAASCRCQRMCARYATSHNDPSRAQPGSGVSRGQHGTLARLRVAVGPLRHRYRAPASPVLMHKSTTIPGHGTATGQQTLPPRSTGGIKLSL